MAMEMLALQVTMKTKAVIAVKAVEISLQNEDSYKLIKRTFSLTSAGSSGNEDGGSTSGN